MEQHPSSDPTGKSSLPGTFDVGVWDMKGHALHTIHACEGMLDVAAGGRVVAVVRNKKIEVWDVAEEKLVKAARFEHTRIDAARFSPDGKLLAISDQNHLVLWQWEAANTSRSTSDAALGRSSPRRQVPGGRTGAGRAIQVRRRDRKVVQTLGNGTKRSMNVPPSLPRAAGCSRCDSFSQRALRCPTGSRLGHGDWPSHEIALPAGLPVSIDASLSGRYSPPSSMVPRPVACSPWRLDGTCMLSPTD